MRLTSDSVLPLQLLPATVACVTAGLGRDCNANMGSANVCTAVCSAYQTMVHTTVLRHTGWHDCKYYHYT
jgi:hypothetical protein